MQKDIYNIEIYNAESEPIEVYIYREQYACVLFVKTEF